MFRSIFNLYMPSSDLRFIKRKADEQTLCCHDCARLHGRSPQWRPPQSSPSSNVCVCCLHRTSHFLSVSAIPVTVHLSDLDFHAQVVELTGNAGMSGTFGYAATEENDRRSSLCVTAESGLRILNMANLGLFDLQIPSCLMGAQSTLEEIRLGGSSIIAYCCNSIYDNNSSAQCI